MKKIEPCPFCGSYEIVGTHEKGYSCRQCKAIGPNQFVRWNDRLPPNPPTEKICRNCHNIKKLDEFYRDRTGKLGRQAYCKKCSLLFDRAKVKTERRNILSKAWAKRQMADKTSKTYMRKRAAVLFHYRLRRGDIKKKPCAVCGDLLAQAHHDDYTKPLDVVWYCTFHHLEWHRNNKAIYPTV